MNSKNSKTSATHRLLLNLVDKIKLKRSDKYVALSNLSMYYTWKNTKTSYKVNKFKVLNYLMDYIISQIFKIILRILSKNMKK